jgi:hypothetical protein
MNLDFIFKEIVVFSYKKLFCVFLLYQDSMIILLLELTKQKDLIMSGLIRFIALVTHSWK